MRSARAAGPFALALLTGCGFHPLPSGATVQSEELHAMWIVFFWTGLGVAIVIWGLIGWCVVRYRRTPADATFPPQFRRNNRMEVVYTGIPILMACGLFAITYAAERHVETIAPQQSVIVNVTGYQWSWRFDYPQLGFSIGGSPKTPPVFELPIGETTRVSMTSVDVDHSFWVPGFLFKRDAIPGLQNVFDWTPKKLGFYLGECGEFCGIGHAKMSFGVRVVSPSDFARWSATHRRVALAGTDAGSAR